MSHSGLPLRRLDYVGCPSHLLLYLTVLYVICVDRGTEGGLQSSATDSAGETAETED